MRLEPTNGSMVIHNRRFARRGGAHAHFSHPNPATRAAPRPLPPIPTDLDSPAENFSAVFPSAARALSPLDDANFVAECADGILNGMMQAVIGLDPAGTIKTCNAAGLQMLGKAPDRIYGATAAEIFEGNGAWIAERAMHVLQTRAPDRIGGRSVDFAGKQLSVNAMIFPLVGNDGAELLGAMIMLDDVSAEREMQTAMSHYMNPGLFDRLSAERGDMLTSKDTVATILFTDLRGFTAITEEIGPQKTVRLLNKYFTLMVDCVEAENGAVDKFAGDSLMAGFGISRHRGDEEDRAVCAGIAMHAALDAWNAQRLIEGRKPMRIGVGVATDLVVSGAVGSPKRMDFTLIGDGVNLAARLESACKYYGTRILIAESTYLKLTGSYKIREIDEVLVHGRSLPVRIYEVLGHHDGAEPDPAIEIFHRARACYIGGDWDSAIVTFQEVLALNPDDKVCALYIERCEQLKKLPPAHWTGIWTLETK